MRDPYNVRTSVIFRDGASANSPLAILNLQGYLDAADALAATRIAKAVNEPAGSWSTVALALAARAARDGSTALDLADVSAWPPIGDDESDDIKPLGEVVDLPDSDAWRGEVSRSQLAAEGALRVDLSLVYLDRYYTDEILIAGALTERQNVTPAQLDETAVRDAIANRELDAAQERAVWSVVNNSTTVLTGGPGMGKTHTLASVIAAVQAANPDARIALAAPTGKAAARMTESVTDGGVTVDPATTLHRLLGPIGLIQRFRHHASNPLPHDLIVVDEASMVSLSMMARFMEALPTSTRLLLVGDPDQLASVEAGNVLGDLVAGLDAEHDGDSPVVRLSTYYRFDARRGELAHAFRAGDADGVFAAMTAPDSQVTFISTDEPALGDVADAVHQAQSLRQVALTGDADAALGQLEASRLLCAHRTGAAGTHRWNRLIEQALADDAPEVAHQEMYVGRPILVTRNDYAVGLANGDTGVIIRTPDGQLQAVFRPGDEIVAFSPWRLGHIETMHAMTIHKAQGSQAEHVTVLVPPLGSRLLVREMLYTAVTRAQTSLTVIGSEEAIREAIAAPVRRSSGLAQRLLASPRPSGAL